MAPTNRRKAALAAVLLALAALVLALRCGGPAAPLPPAPTAAPEPAPRVAEPPLAPPARAPIQKVDPTPLPDEPLVPIIDEVIVEKPEVCRGEENLVTVRAHTEGGAEDAYLHYFIVSGTGMSVPLKLHQRDDEADGDVQREIIVFGRNNVSTKVTLPPYTIKDCDVPRQLNLSHRVLPNTQDVLELTATVRDIAAAEPMQPVRYRWDFGDGTTAETTSRHVAHDYGGRAQDTHYSQFVVTCEAVGADGEVVVGRTGLQLLNVAFEELTQKGLVRLFVSLEPRFPELAADGTVTQGVRMWHLRPAPVRLTRVVVQRTRRGATSKDPPEVREVPPRDIVGTDVLGEGGVFFQVGLNTRTDAETAVLEFYVEGVSAEGLPARGNFALMRPPDLPTRENSRPVVSAYMKAKILRAREVLNKEFVTDEEIWRLEREGYMDDIRPEDYPAPEPIPEPPRPK